MSEAEVRAIQTWLRSEWHIQVPPAWLDACVDWIKEEAGRASIPQSQLHQRVLEQWLLTDLRDLAHPVLPERISEAQKTQLSNCCCVQMDSLLDISQPAYTQLQRIRGSDCSNDQVSAVTQETQRPWEAKPTRVLMMQLTDGVQSMEGMEYRPIPALSTNLSPGTKLQLVGPIVVRLGVLLLKAENVRVLGGEVEHLMETYSQGRVLCGTLGLPVENLPQREEPDDQELLAVLDHPVADSGYRSRTSEASLRSAESQPLPRDTPRQDDWDMDEIPDDDFRSIPDNFEDVPQHDDIVNDVPEDFDDIPLEELDSVMIPIDLPRTREASEMNHSNQSKPEELRNILSSRTLDEVPIASCSTNKLQSSACIRDPQTPVYLCTLQAGCWPPTSAQVFRLQAFIVTLVGNLRSSGGMWKLGATISDGSGYLDVDLSDAMLSGLIGFSAAEARVMRKDPARRGNVDRGIQHCQRELVDMCCMMSIQVDQTGKGVMLSSSPLSDRECDEMEKRVKERRS